MEQGISRHESDWGQRNGIQAGQARLHTVGLMLHAGDGGEMVIVGFVVGYVYLVVYESVC